MESTEKWFVILKFVELFNSLNNMVTNLSATTVKKGSANKNQDSVTVQPISNLKSFQKHILM